MPCVSGTKFIQALTALVLMTGSAEFGLAFPFDWNAEFVNFREAPTVGRCPWRIEVTEIIVRSSRNAPYALDIRVSYLRIDPDFELPITIDATANYDDASIR